MVSTDGGTTWTSQSVPIGISSVEYVSCAAADVCVATGQQASGGTAVALTTTDGGSAWAEHPLPLGFSPSTLACPSVSVCE
ncbi:MAG: hypothetical protein M0007_13120, partial [Actinomycetota bacterium]|nr:hypothetical protein [Actinomycetota bacterium]